MRMGQLIGTPLGTVNDALIAVQFGLLAVAAGGLHKKTGWGIALFGVLIACTVALIQALLVTGVVAFSVNAPIVTVGLLLQIAWMVLVSLTAAGAIGRGPSWLAFVIGAALLVGGAIFVAAGGLTVRSPAELFSNYPALAAGLLVGICISIGLPIWTLWLGAELKD